jgi:hypothetical protein
MNEGVDSTYAVPDFINAVETICSPPKGALNAVGRTAV